MRQPTFKQAARLIQLAVDSGWNAELTQRTLIEEWDIIRTFIQCLHAGLVSEETIRDLRRSLDLERGDWESFLCAQAGKYYNVGWRESLGGISFHQYRSQCPEVPEVMRFYEQDFPYLVLVDDRPGLEAMCAMLKISKIDVKLPKDEANHMPYWIRCHHGWRNRDKNPLKIISRLDESHEAPLRIAEALCLYAQYPKVLRSVDIDMIAIDECGKPQNYVLSKERKSCTLAIMQPDESGKFGSDPRCGLATKKTFSIG